MPDAHPSDGASDDVPPTPDAPDTRERRLIEAARREALALGIGTGGSAGGGSWEEIEPVPPEIAGYRIVRRIATGGMGTVYEAEQEQPRRSVAIKVIKTGAFTQRALRRFEHETRVLARLQHPGIAQIFEAGTLETPAGLCPFFSMELVAGQRLTDYARSKQLSLAEKLKLIARVCDAVQHAHLKGIIHRDLKPANVLVGEDGRPKVLDFGVARATDVDIRSTTAYTQIGEPVGTIPYMSPEQLGGDPDEIDTRSDVYALGVVCYQLLAGRMPYSLGGKPWPDVFRAICEEDPPRLGALSSEFRGDVETIIAKAMEKDRDRRYQSVAALADDVRRYLRHEPIQARPVGRIARLLRWSRREPRTAALAVTLLLLLVLLAVGSTAAALRIAAARKGEQRALSIVQQLNSRQRRGLYAAQMNLAMQAFRRGDIATVDALLESQIPQSGEDDLRGFEWRYLWKQIHGDLRTLPAHAGAVRQISYSPRGTWLASCGEDGTTLLWDTTTWEVRHRLSGHAGAINAVAFSPDGTMLATAGDDRKVVLWDVASGKRLHLFQGHEWPVQSVAFSHDGQRLASGAGKMDRLHKVSESPGEVKLWNVSRRTLHRSVEHPLTAVTQVQFAPDDRLLIVTLWSTWVAFFSADGQEHLNAIPPEWTGEARGTAFSPDGSVLSVASWGEELTQWDARSLPERKKKGALPARRVLALAYQPDGTLLATGSDDDTDVRIWDPTSGTEVAILQGHAGAVTTLAFSPDGRRLVSGSSDGTLKVWNPSSQNRPTRLQAHTLEIDALDVSPDGRKLVTAGRDSTFAIWNLDTRTLVKRVRTAGGWVNGISLSTRENILATCGSPTQEVEVWDATSGEKRFGLTGFPQAVDRATFSPDGKRLVAVSNDVSQKTGDLLFWDTETWRLQRRMKQPHELGIYAVAFSRDGRLLATGGKDEKVRVWDAHTLAPLHTLQHTGWVPSLAFSPDGTKLAAGSWPYGKPQNRPVDVKVWDLASGRELLNLRGHKEAVFGLAFTPDGKELATGGGTGDVKIWDALTGDVRATFDLEQRGWVFGVAFTPDGNTLICTEGSNTTPGDIVLFDAAPPEEITPPRTQQR